MVKISYFQNLIVKRVKNDKEINGFKNLAVKRIRENNAKIAIFRYKIVSGCALHFSLISE